MRDHPADGERIYLDHAATSPLRGEVWAAMQAALGEADFNAASSHGFGSRARSRLEEARGRLAGLLGAPVSELRFTAGGTAGRQRGRAGLRARAVPARTAAGPRLRHRAQGRPASRRSRRSREGARSSSSRSTARAGRSRGLEAALDDGDGRPTPRVHHVGKQRGRDDPAHCRGGAMAPRHGALFHSDAVQGFGKLDMRRERAPVRPADGDRAQAGRTGRASGAWSAARHLLEPLMFGGAQERGVWPGTQNPMARSASPRRRVWPRRRDPALPPRWRALRDLLAAGWRRDPRSCACTARARRNACRTCSAWASRGRTGDAARRHRPRGHRRLQPARPAAAGRSTGSHVLDAMGAGTGSDELRGLRFSFGPGTTSEEVERAGRARPVWPSRCRERADPRRRRELTVAGRAQSSSPCPAAWTRA